MNPSRHAARPTRPFKRTALALACSLLLSACGTSEQDPTLQSQKHLKLADSYAEQGQYRAAMIEARNAIQKNPSAPEGALLLSQILLEVGQAKQAVLQLEQLAQELPGNPEVQLALTNAYLERGKWNSAENTLKAAQLTDSEQGALLFGKALQGQGDLEAAKAQFEKVLALNPSHYDATLQLTQVAVRQNELHKAFGLLETLEKLDPNNPQTTLLQAGLAIKDGDLEKTEELLTEALSELPNTDVVTPLRANVLRALADTLTRQGRSSEALIYTKILADAFPGAQLAQSQFAEALKQFNDKDYDGAKATLEALLEEYPQYDPAAQLQALINFTQGNYEAADRYFDQQFDPEVSNERMTTVAALTNMRLRQPEQVMKLLEDQIKTTTDAGTLGLYGLAAFSAGKYSEGESALQKALQLDPEKAGLRLALAEYYNSPGQLDPSRALQQLEMAHQSDAEDSRIQAALTKQYLQLGQKNKAWQVVNQALQSNADNHNTQLLAGDYFLAQDDKAKAADYYQSAVNLKPDDANSVRRLGQLQLQQGANEQTLRTYETFIGAAPANTTGYKGLLLAYRQLDQEAKGIQALEQVSGAGTAAAQQTLSEYYLLTADFAKARQHAQALAEFSNSTYNQAMAAIDLREAAMLYGQQQTDAARKLALNGLGYAPQSTQLLNLLASIELAEGNYGEAEKIIKQIEGVQPTLAQQLTGDLFYIQENYPQAIGEYESVWAVQPTEGLARNLYNAYLKSGQANKGKGFLDQWLAVIPNSLVALTTRGTEAIGKGRYKEAITDLEQASTLNPNAAIVLNNLAWAYAQVNNPAALSTAEKAYELEPENAAIADTYGWLLVQNQQRAKGRDVLEKAAQLAPDNQEIQEHLRQARGE